MIPVTTTLAAPDPLSKFTTVPALATLFNTLLTSTIDEDVTPYIVGAATPNVEDQDKVWHKIDTAGRPRGTYLYYNGAWRQEYTGLPGQARLFFGDPTVNFDINGRGLVGGDWDGWHLANGKDAIPNLSNRFLIMGQIDNVDITGFQGTTWHTNINGVAENSGGNATITLDTNNTFRPATAELKAGLFTSGSDSRDASGPLYGTVGDGTHPETTLITADAGNTTPDAIPISPPFFCLAIAVFVGYE